jgi:NhaP-type Na+/H+ or K+/H+ antiporter
VTWKKIFAVVTISALIGMVMGGLFGLAAARLAPDFFRHVIPWQDVEPVGMATLLGATAGVLLGGGLGCFGVLVQTALLWKKRGMIDK